MRPIVHAMTPGDHFSPRTGSALPTVIDSLARAAEYLGENRPQRVLVAEGTYEERYSSVTVLDYRQRPAPGRIQRVADVLTGRLVGVRPYERRCLKTMLTNQQDWPPSFIVAHNLVQLVPLVDMTRHRAVLYAHNDLLRTYSRSDAAKALANAALIVCVSEFLAERIRQRLPESMHRRVVVTPNAADCEQFTPGNVQTDRLRVAFLGRMVPDKGADVLLQAAGLLDEQRLEITVVGSSGFDEHAELTPFERRLRHLAEDLRATVNFRPFTDRLALPELLRSQDILVVPSRWPEPWGLTVSEGQAAGLVVLASNIGGIPEAISDQSHLVPPDAPEAVANQLRRFLDDRQLLEEHRRSARTYAETHDWRYSWRTFARYLASVR